MRENLKTAGCSHIIQAEGSRLEGLYDDGLKTVTWSGYMRLS